MTDDRVPASPPSVHVLGVGGVGMSAVALWARALEIPTTGSDRRSSPIVERAKAAGVDTRLTPWPEAARAAGLFCSPAGVPADHPELQAAVPVHRDQALARLCGHRAVIAVLGPVHGSACALGLATAFESNPDVGWAVGAFPRDQSWSHARLPRSQAGPIVVELDPRRPLPDFARLDALVVADWPAEDEAFGYFGERAASTVRNALEAAARARGARVVSTLPRPSDLQTPGLAAAHMACRAIDPRLPVTLPTALDALAALDQRGVDGQLEPIADGHRHDFRTHGLAIASLAATIAASAARLTIVLKPWSVSLRATGPNALARAFDAADRVVVLPPYADDDRDGANRLVDTLRTRCHEVVALAAGEGALDVVLPLCTARQPSEAWLWLGGDDVATLAAAAALPADERGTPHRTDPL